MYFLFLCIINIALPTDLSFLSSFLFFLQQIKEVHLNFQFALRRLQTAARRCGGSSEAVGGFCCKSLWSRDRRLVCEPECLRFKTSGGFWDEDDELSVQSSRQQYRPTMSNKHLKCGKELVSKSAATHLVSATFLSLGPRTAAQQYVK